MTTHFDAIEFFPQVFGFQKRSSDLDGTIPVRAAKHCSPFLDGCGSGLQIEAFDCFLSWGKKGLFSLGSWSNTFPQQQEYQAVLQKMTQQKLVAPYWLRKLKSGLCWQQGHFCYIWTGQLVRPAKNVWLMIGGAFNRRVPLTIEELIWHDHKNFVPVILKIDSRNLTEPIYQMSGDLATVLCLSPKVHFQNINADRSPQLAKSAAKRMSDFYSAQYFETKSSAPTGQYRKLQANSKLARQSNRKFKIIQLGSEKTEIHHFKFFVGKDGIKRNRTLSSKLQFPIFRARFPIHAEWNGHQWSNFEQETTGFARLESRLSKILGKSGAPFIGNLSVYAKGTRFAEPTFMIFPWVLIETPSDWSSFYDGIHHGSLEGLRGVVSTDVYHKTMAVYKQLTIGSLKITPGTPILRVLPLPNSFLRPRVVLQSVEFFFPAAQKTRNK